MTDAIRSRAMHERTRLRMALKRWHEGEYGWCAQCGETIAAGRLEFDPATPLCIDCACEPESE